jgi:hypothetical protein
MVLGIGDRREQNRPFCTILVQCMYFSAFCGTAYSRTKSAHFQRTNLGPPALRPSRISSRDAFPRPDSIFCFLHFHRKILRLVPPDPFRPVRDNKEHFRMNLERFDIVRLDCNCSSTRNRHIVPRRQDFGIRLREINGCRFRKISVCRKRRVNAHHFASSFHIVNRQQAFIGQIEPGSHQVVRT